VSQALDVPEAAKDAVVHASNDMTWGGRPLATSDLYVVWSVKVLRNWKALVSTDVTEGAYWEVTHNGAANETYVDLYRKSRNVVLREM